MNRPIWLDPFVLLLQGAIVLLPPTAAAFGVAHLVIQHYGMSHRSPGSLACLIALNVFLLTSWITGLMQANKFWNARRKNGPTKFE